MLGTLRDNFAGTVSKWSDRKAILYGERTYTYGDLNTIVNRLANFLAHLGVKKGDGVGLLLYNCAEFAAGFLAGEKSGGELGAVVQEQPDPVALFHPKVGEKIGEPIDDRVQIAVRVGALAVQDGLSVRPFGNGASKVIAQRTKHLLIPPDKT